MVDSPVSKDRDASQGAEPPSPIGRPSGGFNLRGSVTVAALLAAAAANAQTATARVDSAAMLIGDPNRLVVAVEGLPAGATFLVDWSPLDTVEAFRPAGEEVRLTGEAGPRAALPFSVYDSVGLLLPALPVILPDDTLYTNDVAVLVDFPEAEGPLNDYRSIKPEPAQLSDYLPWLIAGALALLALGGAFWFFARARENDAPPAPAAPPPPPHEVALAELAVLRKRTDLDDKAYYSRLDHVLRRYLEDRYRVPALERTSGEVVRLLRDRDLPDAAELGRLLGHVDLIKFARAEGSPAERSAAVDRVEAFVRATLPPPPSEPAERNALIVEHGDNPPR